MFEEKDLPIESLKWNKMWDLWAKGETISPYQELMTYSAEINNGGHAQYFDNVSSSTDLAESINQLYSILKDPLKSNLKEAYDSYLKYDEFSDELSDILDDCDTVFYKNEEDLNDLLWEYAKSIEL